MSLKTAIAVVVKLGISGLLVWLFLRQVDLGLITAAGARISGTSACLAVGLFVLSNLLGAVQWRLLLGAQAIEMPFPRVVSLYFVGVFFNNFLVSNIGGDAVRVYDIQQMTGRATAGFAATFMDRFIGLATLIVFSIVAFSTQRGLWMPGGVTPLAVLAAGLIGILCFGFSRRLSQWVLGVCEHTLPRAVVSVLGDVREGFIQYRHGYGLLAKVAVVAAGVQLSRVAVYYVVGWGMGLEVYYSQFLVFIPLIAIVAALPVSFGGIGVRENLGALLFGRVGVSAPDALAMMFLGYVAGIVASLAGGIAFVLRRGHKTATEGTETSEQGT